MVCGGYASSIREVYDNTRTNKAVFDCAYSLGAESPFPMNIHLLIKISTEQNSLICIQLSLFHLKCALGYVVSSFK